MDAVHDIFVQLDRSLIGFRGHAEPATWIYRIATNHCLNRLRRRRTEARVVAELAEVHRLLTPYADDPSLAFDRRRLLIALLAELNERDLQVLLYCHYDGMKQREVADLLGISERAVRKRLTKALAVIERQKPNLEIESLDEHA